MQPVLDRLIGYFDCQVGPSDQVIHLYRYESFEDWQSRVHGLQGAAHLQPYFQAVRPLMLAQENTFLSLAPLPQLNPLWAARSDRFPSDLYMGRTALVEESVQQLVPGALPVFWDRYGRCELQRGGAVTDHLVACFYSLVGRFHQVVHYRSYSDDQARRLHRLMEGVGPLTLTCESRLLQPSALPQLSPLFRD